MSTAPPFVISAQKDFNYINIVIKTTYGFYFNETLNGTINIVREIDSGASYQELDFPLSFDYNNIASNGAIVFSVSAPSFDQDLAIKINLTLDDVDYELIQPVNEEEAIEFHYDTIVQDHAVEDNKYYDSEVDIILAPEMKEIELIINMDDRPIISQDGLSECTFTYSGGGNRVSIVDNAPIMVKKDSIPDVGLLPIDIEATNLMPNDNFDDAIQHNLWQDWVWGPAFSTLHYRTEYFTKNGFHLVRLGVYARKTKGDTVTLMSSAFDWDSETASFSSFYRAFLRRGTGSLKIGIFGLNHLNKVIYSAENPLPMAETWNEARTTLVDIPSNVVKIKVGFTFDVADIGQIDLDLMAPTLVKEYNPIAPIYSQTTSDKDVFVITGDDLILPLYGSIIMRLVNKSATINPFGYLFSLTNGSDSMYAFIKNGVLTWHINGNDIVIPAGPMAWLSDVLENNMLYPNFVEGNRYLLTSNIGGFEHYYNTIITANEAEWAPTWPIVGNTVLVHENQTAMVFDGTTWKPYPLQKSELEYTFSWNMDPERGDLFCRVYFNGVELYNGADTFDFEPNPITVKVGCSLDNNYQIGAYLHKFIVTSQIFGE